MYLPNFDMSVTMSSTGVSLVTDTSMSSISSSCPLSSTENNFLEKKNK